MSVNLDHFSPGRDEHKNCLKPPPSHGSVKNGCISNTSYRPSNTTAFSTSRTMGERVRCIEVETECFCFQSIMFVVSMWVHVQYIPVLKNYIWNKDIKNIIISSRNTTDTNPQHHLLPLHLGGLFFSNHLQISEMILKRQVMLGGVLCHHCQFIHDSSSKGKPW